jgi:hypothetical protein
MKCLVCGKESDKKILCNGHMGTDRSLKFLQAHICGSFLQRKGEIEGICNNNLSCKPVKMALKGEPFFQSGLGHIACPHASVNISWVMYNDFIADQIKSNYPECMK